MLFLMQSKVQYLRQAIVRQVPRYIDPKKDETDDELLLAWFTYFQRYYAEKQTD